MAAELDRNLNIVVLMGGWSSERPVSLMSGEGIVAEFSGPGELLIQTRNLAALAGLLKPFFPTQGGGSGG